MDTECLSDPENPENPEWPKIWFSDPKNSEFY